MLAQLFNYLRSILAQRRPGFYCPKCWRPMDHYKNVDANHWGVCPHCRATWLIGRNLFSNWRTESHQTWEDNNAYLSQFEVFRPGGAQ